jgi:hypothetical protein
MRSSPACHCIPSLVDSTAVSAACTTLRRRTFQHQASAHQHDHAGKSHGRAPSRQRCPVQRHFRRTDAFPRFQPQPDVGLDFRRHAIPGNLRQFRQFGQQFPHFVVSGHLFAAFRAVGQVPRRQPPAGMAPGRPPRATPMLPDSGVSSYYRFLLSMYRRNFVRPLAICERTVAFEQFSRCGHFLRR